MGTSPAPGPMSASFSLRLDPAFVTVTQGDSAATFVYVTPAAGTHPMVNLSLPNGMDQTLMGSFDPPATDGRSMVMLMPMRDVAPGLFDVVVQGVAGNAEAKAHLYVTVKTAPPSPVPHGANPVLTWNNAALQAIRDLKPGPPATSRALAIVHTCIYDAWAAYDPVALSTRSGSALRRPLPEHTAANKAEAISYAAYRALVDLFPEIVPTFDQVMADLGYDPADLSRDPTTPRGIGNLAATVVLAYRHGDGSNQLGDLNPGAGPYQDYTGYQPVNPPIWVTRPTALADLPHPDRWQPLTFQHAGVTMTPKFIGPHWGKVLPFALASGDQFRPAPPRSWGDPALKAQIDEVLELQAGLTDVQKCIAEYWADGPNSELPPGHFNLFAQVVSGRDHHGLDEDAKLFFALTNAIFDAGISCWDAKRAYDFCRPVTAIRALYNASTVQGWRGPGLGVGAIAGAAWKPFQPDSFPTPPFPEYTSGHSAFSAAGAEVLRRFTGSDAFGHTATIKARSLKAEPSSPAADVVLSWPTFTAAADQAGISRRYGGIHFLDGDLRSREMGLACGILAYEKARSFWEGRIPAQSEE